MKEYKIEKIQLSFEIEEIESLFDKLAENPPIRKIKEQKISNKIQSLMFTFKIVFDFKQSFNQPLILIRRSCRAKLIMKRSVNIVIMNIRSRRQAYKSTFNKSNLFDLIVFVCSICYRFFAAKIFFTNLSTLRFLFFLSFDINNRC